ncbi:MAG: TIM barrel protein [Thermomicrobiales bacterium]|nr:TIM barrel protein [Thermomicrobiales bacterium]
MSGPKASFTWWSFADRGAEASALIRDGAAMGYDGIELADVALWPAIADAGLAIVSHRGHEPLESGLNRRENHDRIEREILANLALAQEWRCPLLICFAGNRDGLSEEAGIENTAAGLARVAGAAEEAGVTLALELLNSKVDHPDYQGNRTVWGLEVLARVASPAVKLLYDVYHMQVMEGDIIRTIGEHHDAFAHYHVAGNPGRREPDAAQELAYPAIYRSIAATGFDGYIGMEYLPTGNPIASLQASLQQLRAALGQA